MRPNLALVFVCLCYSIFLRMHFCISFLSALDWLGRVSPKRPILCRVGHAICRNI